MLCVLGQVPFLSWASPVSGSEGPVVAEVPCSPATQDCTFRFQKLASERDALQRELEDLRKKSEGVRSRNKVLSSEVKTLRSQMGTLVEKGRHDDELIDALMVRPSCPGKGNSRGPGPQHATRPHPAQKPAPQPQPQ